MVNSSLIFFAVVFCIFIAVLCQLLYNLTCCVGNDYEGLRCIFCCRHERNVETPYELLSSERKLELDNFRSKIILRLLSRFTCSLKLENMLRQPSTFKMSSMSDDSAGCEEEVQHIADDIEMGCFVDEEDRAEYTHVLIPHPGEAIKERDSEVVEDCCAKNGPKNMSWPLVRKKIFIDSGEDVCYEKTQNDENKSDVDRSPLPCMSINESAAETRAVPMFCAVCLAKYELSDRVCWSSNSDCTHVFHEDCMLQWLLALGRKSSRGRRFSRNPTEMQLMEFDKTCPCCRQDFILFE